VVLSPLLCDQRVSTLSLRLFSRLRGHPFSIGSKRRPDVAYAETLSAEAPPFFKLADPRLLLANSVFSLSSFPVFHLCPPGRPFGLFLSPSAQWLCPPGFHPFQIIVGPHQVLAMIPPMPHSLFFPVTQGNGGAPLHPPRNGQPRLRRPHVLTHKPRGVSPPPFDFPMLVHMLRLHASGCPRFFCPRRITDEIQSFLERPQHVGIPNNLLLYRKDAQSFLQLSDNFPLPSTKCMLSPLSLSPYTCKCRFQCSSILPVPPQKIMAPDFRSLQHVQKQ